MTEILSICAFRLAATPTRSFCGRVGVVSTSFSSKHFSIFVGDVGSRSESKSGTIDADVSSRSESFNENCRFETTPSDGLMS